MNRVTNYLSKVFFISPDVPYHVDIEIATVCNLACKMCKRETIDFGNQLMPYEKFTKIIDELPLGVEVISFGGYGEMLLHPRFYDMVRYAREKGYATETTSNGTMLNTPERRLHLIESGLSSLRVSIDHIRAPLEEKDVGHVFSTQVIENLKTLNTLRKEKKSNLSLGINIVVHKSNVEEVIDIIKLADELGLDHVELIRLDTCKNHAERTLTLEREKTLYEEIERMPKQLTVVTPANRFAKWRALYNIKQEFCPFRFSSAHIRMNGAVTPCAFGFAVADFGNIHKQDMKTIWQSTAFKNVRKNDKNATCASCGIFKWGKPKKGLTVLQ